MPACKACGEWFAKTRDDRVLCSKCEMALGRLAGYAVVVTRCKDCANSYEDAFGRVCAYGICADCTVPDDFYCASSKPKEGTC